MSPTRRRVRTCSCDRSPSDIVERDDDNRLRRIVMFFGPLPSPTNQPRASCCGSAGASAATAQEARQQTGCGWTPVVLQRQASCLAGARDAGAVRVAPSRRIALGHDEHVLAERREQVAAEGAAVGGRLAVGRRAHGIPASGGEGVHGVIFASRAPRAAGLTSAIDSPRRPGFRRRARR